MTAHIPTKKTIRRHTLTLIFVFTCICTGFILLGNVFLMVMHDARTRMIDTTVDSVTKTLGVISQQNIDQSALDTIVEGIARDTPGLLDVHVIDESATTSVIRASLRDESTQEGGVLPYHAQTVQTAKALPEQVITTTDGALLYSVFVFTDSEGVYQGYVEAVFQPALFAEAVQRNSVRAGILLLGILGVVALLLFWFIGIGEHQRLLRKTAHTARMHDELLSRLVHEIQTPLTVISGYISMIHAHTDTLDASVKQHIKRIKHAGVQLERLMRNISYAVDLERYATAYVPTIQSPVPIVQRVIETVTQQYPTQTPIEYTSTSVDTVYVDATYVSIALEQILINAIQHTVTHPVCVTLYTKGGDVCISIKDFGKGMTPDEVFHAKEKWFRGTLPHHDTHRGSGLGLWIAEHVIRKMHGRMYVESTVGVGTTVTITLPRAH